MLYTRKGDKGTTKLFNCPTGKRVSKSDYVFEVLGSLDELNSLIGYTKVLAKKEKIKLKIKEKRLNKSYEELLEDIQHALFTLQASFAGSDKKLKKDDISFLEEAIDGIEKEIPKINSFLVPGHSELSAFLDILRSNSRRLERTCVKFKVNHKQKVNENHLVFLNRLSSFFYALERYVNFIQKSKEKKPKYRS
jgi:cob(I)alamin adenosyltransferase